MGLRRSFRTLRSKLVAVFRDRGWRVPHILLTKDEPFVRRVAETLGPEDVVLDIGAHVGASSIEFARFAGKVYAFEPHPEIFETLRHGTRKYPNIEPIQAAVSDVAGRAKLFFEPPKATKPFDGATLVEGKSNVSYDNAFDVETIGLADFVLGLDQPVRMIKMDIEGAEYRVLSALLDTDAVDRIGKIWVEPHEDRIPGLAAERAAVEARIAERGLQDKFDFTWP